jgi:MFS family permease
MAILSSAESRYAPDGAYAWWRLGAALLLSTVGGVGLWSCVVVLPAIQAEFDIDRGDASLPYTATLAGFAIGTVLMGRLVDRFGARPPLLLGAVCLALGYLLAGLSASYWQFIVAQALLIGMLGSSAFLAPLIADTSHWFRQRRGLAVAIVSSGSYVAGAIWPPILQYAVEQVGWRQAHMVVGLLCLVVIVPLALLFGRRATIEATPNGSRSGAGPGAGRGPSALSPGMLQTILIVAGFACCIAMAMPQVHIVAYCGDLGYGVARGAEMLSLMLSMGIISRLASGLIADRIGGVATLALGSTLQCLALLFYIPFNGLTSLYVVSALFGLSQGGIVPSYALIVREYFPAREAGERVSVVLMATLVGMAVGGWLSGEIYDLTGSYRAAFLNGIAWNLLNMSIAFWLLLAQTRRASAAAA